MWLFNPDAELIDERAANRDAMASLIRIDPFESMVPYGGVNGGEFIVNGVAMSEKDLEQFSQHSVNPGFCTPYELRKAEQEELVDNGTIFNDRYVDANTDFWDALEMPPENSQGQEDNGETQPNPFCTVQDVRPDEALVPGPGIPMSLSLSECHEEKNANADDGGHDSEIKTPPYRMSSQVHPYMEHVLDHEHVAPALSFIDAEKMRREKSSHGDSNHDEEAHGI